MTIDLSVVALLGLMGSMQQKDLEEWLSQCSNASLAASLRDFLSKSICGLPAPAVSDSRAATGGQGMH